MYLDEFAVRVIAALLIERRLRRTRADDGVGRLAEDRPDAAGRDNESVGREGANLHAAQVHRADAAADFIAVEHRRQKFPVLELLYFSFGFIPPHLFVECVKKLLTSSRSRKSSAVIQSSAEAAEVEQSFGRAVERNAHAVKEVDDPRRGLAHILNRRLVSEEVSAIDRVVKMFPGRIALA